MNCWEVKKCGRQIGGEKVKELGVCPAATEKRANGIHSGLNGGRCCYAIAGTLCGGKMQGSFAQKLSNCMTCDFYKLVMTEEGLTKKTATEILKIISLKQKRP